VVAVVAHTAVKEVMAALDTSAAVVVEVVA
jgi:hypothetical protein